MSVCCLLRNVVEPLRNFVFILTVVVSLLLISHVFFHKLGDIFWSSVYLKLCSFSHDVALLSSWCSVLINTTSIHTSSMYCVFVISTQSTPHHILIRHLFFFQLTWPLCLSLIALKFSFFFCTLHRSCCQPCLSTVHYCFLYAYSFFICLIF